MLLLVFTFILTNVSAQVSNECTNAGFKCTSPIRGCGLDYQRVDLDCGDIVICCEDVGFCGDGICDENLEHEDPGEYPFPEEACPQDCRPVSEIPEFSSTGIIAIIILVLAASIFMIRKR